MVGIVNEMSLFRFKKFILEQDDEVFPLGTDAMVLGSLATCPGKSVLDIGTGTGVLSLMIAQRFTNVERIIAIDSNSEAARLAAINFQQSDFDIKPQAQHCKLEEFQTGPASFDLIITNPPFHLESLKAKSLMQKQAKHGDWDFFRILFKNSSFWLTESGRLAMIVAYYDKSRIIDIATEHELNVIKAVAIRPSADKKNLRCVLEFAKTKQNYTEDQLILMDSRGYTSSFKQLTRDFYLNH